MSSKKEKKYEDRTREHENHRDETPGPSGHFATDLARIVQVKVLQRSTLVARYHLFSRISLHLIGFRAIRCISRTFTIRIYTVNLKKALGPEKSDISRLRWRVDEVILGQSK